MEIINMIAELKNALEDMEDRIEGLPKTGEQKCNSVENKKEKKIRRLVQKIQH